MYFSIDDVQPKVEEYARLYPSQESMQIFKEMYPDLKNVIHGVIHTHKFTRYENIQDLESVALQALLSKSGLCKFNANYTNYKGKKENLLFSYISLIVKRSLIFYTSREAKYRYTNPLPTTDDGELYGDKMASRNEFKYEEDNFNYIHFIEEMDSHIRPKFKDTRFYHCYDYLIKYLKINGRFDKRDFLRMVRGMLNTEEDVIPKVTTRLDQDNTLTRANAIIRKTIKLYQLYLEEYLKETDNGFIKLKKSTKQNR